MSNKLKPQQLLDLLTNNKYINTTEIRKIAECGNDKAKQIRIACNTRIHEKGFVNYHETKVPTSILIDVLGIDMDFLRMQVNEKSPLGKVDPIQNKS